MLIIFFSVGEKWDMHSRSRTRSGAFLPHLTRRLPRYDEDVDFGIAGAVGGSGHSSSEESAAEDASSPQQCERQVQSLSSESSSSEDVEEVVPGTNSVCEWFDDNYKLLPFHSSEETAAQKTRGSSCFTFAKVIRFTEFENDGI